MGAHPVTISIVAPVRPVPPNHEGETALPCKLQERREKQTSGTRYTSPVEHSGHSRLSSSTGMRPAPGNLQ